jgi:modulator of FtsH protease HflC
MNRTGILVSLVVALLVVASQSFFIVPEYGQAIVVEVGKIKGQPITQPGFYFKIPIAQEVIYIEKRWLEWDGDRNQIPTKDKKYIWMDAYARWRVKDPVEFYNSVRDEAGAQSRLDDIIDGEIRNVVANHDLIDIVRSSSRGFELSEEEQGEAHDDEEQFMTKVGRDLLARSVLEKAAQVVPAYGIELADVQFKRVNYVESVQEKVFERMISERKRIAQRFRSEGQGKAAEIEGTVDKELRTIDSEAYRKAEEVRGRADGEAAAIYAEAYSKDPELYEFLKTLEAYRTIIDKNTSLVLSTDSDLLGLLQSRAQHPARNR